MNLDSPHKLRGVLAECNRFISKRGLGSSIKEYSTSNPTDLIPDKEKPTEFIFWFSLAIAGRKTHQVKLFLDYHSTLHNIENYTLWLELRILTFLDTFNQFEIDNEIKELISWIRESNQKNKHNTQYSLFSKRSHEQLFTTIKQYVSPEQHGELEKLIYKNIQPERAIAIQILNKTDFIRIFYFLKQ